MKITCDCTKTRKLSELEEFQGDIKTISDKNLDKLIILIEQNGFNVPFQIWGNKIIDGHQRKKALTKMGYTGVVPVVSIEAENEKDAREKLLATASQHGRFSLEGLEEFTLGLTDLDSMSLVDGPSVGLNFKVDLTPKTPPLIDDIEIVDSDEYEQAEVEEIKTNVGDVIEFPDGSVLQAGNDRYFFGECIRLWNARNKAQPVKFVKKDD